MLLGVDVGGTFTDAVVAAGGRLVTAKAPTTPEDQSEGVLAAVSAALERAEASAEEVRAFAHGTTVATNALLGGHREVDPDVVEQRLRRLGEVVHVGRQPVDRGLACLEHALVVGRAALERVIFQDLVLELPVDGAAEVIHRYVPPRTPLRAGRFRGLASESLPIS